MNELLGLYRIAVRHPKVSGFEHLNMLMMRDLLAQFDAELSAEERILLATADQELIDRAAEFYAELARITDLAEERTRRRIPADYWWWYLDVLQFLPLPASTLPEVTAS